MAFTVPSYLWPDGLGPKSCVGASPCPVAVRYASLALKTKATALLGEDETRAVPPSPNPSTHRLSGFGRQSILHTCYVPIWL